MLNCGKVTRKPTGYPTTTRLTVSLTNGIGQSPAPIRLHLELLVLTHHIEEPCVRVTSRADAVGAR